MALPEGQLDEELLDIVSQATHVAAVVVPVLAEACEPAKTQSAKSAFLWAIHGEFSCNCTLFAKMYSEMLTKHPTVELRLRWGCEAQSRTIWASTYCTCFFSGRNDLQSPEMAAQSYQAEIGRSRVPPNHQATSGDPLNITSKHNTMIRTIFFFSFRVGSWSQKCPEMHAMLPHERCIRYVQSFEFRTSFYIPDDNHPS